MAKTIAYPFQFGNIEPKWDFSRWTTNSFLEFARSQVHVDDLFELLTNAKIEP
jgi:hypothetical protein